MSALPARAGIYLLKHDVTGDTYVGSVRDVQARTSGHLRLLRAGKHDNRRMQSVADAHGVHFTCSVLELTGDAPRFPAEHGWFLKLSPTLNQDVPPKEDRRPTGDVSQVNCRLNVSTLARIRDFCASHPFRPTPSRIVELALTEWLDREEPKLPKPRK
jgi:hypothetical protein